MNLPALARLPLWVRLAAAILLLVTVTLTAIGAAGVTVLHGQLLDRIDSQLSSLAKAYPQVPEGPQEEAPAPNTYTAPAVGQYGVYRIQRHDADGKRVKSTHPGPEPRGGPEIPEDAAWLGRHAGHPVTVASSAGEGGWRVLVQPLAGTSGWVAIATALGELDATISKLVTIDLAVGVLGLVLLAVASVMIVRTSLRPLAKIERTAAAIAAGNLSQRVPEHPPRTELGRLGRALNGMLAQIEGAFQARAQSESTARQSEERMRRFVADAGHDLRTPLSVIISWAEYAHRGPPQDHAGLERILSTIGSEATRMSTLVEDLLLLARLDQQRPLERRPVDVLALAVDTVRDARLLAPDRDIHLTADDRADYIVTGDELRLRQALSNLTSNALAHTPPGTPISVELSQGRLDDTAALVLDVADQGPGLTPEQAERVFERFYRTDTSRTRRTGGSGLGLAIVASLAAAHKGTASVHTSPGAGATFRITLPLADAGAPSKERGDPPASSNAL
ncbi:HAMP domain-containing sensor histidine kinase [Actinomadura nitritigenes]|uniref:histidine kinase n=1 Tax=Actinomadura nitritigenes TaxID=134602 RepID=A0ABS3R2Q4_9ACTN|nr:HAMP domain-containing sensor histidine kinase [Actinomadura nitritigenes]MBO2440461.1 HAMP domain-containing histidine kinase [Actinomadura nitritigenes]